MQPMTSDRSSTHAAATRTRTYDSSRRTPPGRADARRGAGRGGDAVQRAGLGRRRRSPTIADARRRRGRDDLQRVRLEEGAAARRDGRRRSSATPSRCRSRTRGVPAARTRTARRRVCARAAAVTADIHERSAGVWHAIVVAAAADAEVETWRAQLERGRRAQIGESLELIVGHPIDARLTDGCWALYSPEVYTLLTATRGGAAPSTSSGSVTRRRGCSGSNPSSPLRERARARAPPTAGAHAAARGCLRWASAWRSRSPGPSSQLQLEQLLHLFGVLDALGDGPQPEDARELDDRGGERRLLAAVGDAVDERLVDLEDVDREAADVVQRRVAGAEVVDRELDAELLQLAEPCDRQVHVLHHHALGDLDHQAARREAGVLEGRARPRRRARVAAAAGPRGSPPCAAAATSDSAPAGHCACVQASRSTHAPIGTMRPGLLGERDEVERRA